MPRGRKPTPTAVKVARGNPGNRALPKDEPTPPPADLDDDMPEGMSDDAQRCWKQVHRILTDAQVLTTMDTPALALYCEAWARYRKAQTELKKRGMVIKTMTGPRKNPWLEVLDKAHDQLLKIQLEYGMTPAARTRVRTAPKGKEPRKPNGDRIPNNVFSMVRNISEGLKKANG
jgi:P27 family predicted phage terminase small subunit